MMDQQNPKLQETNEGPHYATTSTVRPGNAQLAILQQNRQLSSITQFHQPDGLYSNVFDVNGQLNLIVQFVVSIKDKRSQELWRYHIKSRRLPRNQLHVNIPHVGNFWINPKAEPFPTSASIILLGVDCKQKQLPFYAGSVAFVLPVEQERRTTYTVTLTLSRENIEVDKVTFKIESHDRGSNLFEYQSGRSITNVEKPLPKIQMSGILGDKYGQRILLHFQRLGDNGQYNQFTEDYETLCCPTVLSKKHYDLVLAVTLEKSIVQFDQNKVEDCLNTCRDVWEKALECNSPNLPFLLTKAFYIMSAVHRQDKDFDVAGEFMDKSNQCLEQVTACNETAVNRYNWAALLAEKSANGGLTPQQKDEAIKCFKDAVRLWIQHGSNEEGDMRCVIRTCNREIMFYLKASRTSFPDLRLTVTEIDIARASEIIESVEENLRHCPKRLVVTFLIGKADFNIRKAMSKATACVENSDRVTYLKRAKSILKKAKTISQVLELEKETEGINDRMEKIQNLLENGLRQHFPTRGQAEGSYNEPSENEMSTITQLLEDVKQYENQEKIQPTD